MMPHVCTHPMLIIFIITLITLEYLCYFSSAPLSTADYGIIFGHTGNMRLLFALIRRKLPVAPDAPDADAPDAYYPQRFTY